jgi:hypothetical protein
MDDYKEIQRKMEILYAQIPKAKGTELIEALKEKKRLEEELFFMSEEYRLRHPAVPKPAVDKKQAIAKTLRATKALLRL